MKRPGSLQPDQFKDDPKNSRRIVDGEYQIVTSLDNDKVVTTNGYPFYHGVIQQNNNMDHHRWKLEYDSQMRAYTVSFCEKRGSAKYYLAKVPWEQVI